MIKESIQEASYDYIADNSWIVFSYLGSFFCNYDELPRRFGNILTFTIRPSEDAEIEAIAKQVYQRCESFFGGEYEDEPTGHVSVVTTLDVESVFPGTSMIQSPEPHFQGLIIPTGKVTRKKLKALIADLTSYLSSLTVLVDSGTDAVNVGFLTSVEEHDPVIFEDKYLNAVCGWAGNALKCLENDGIKQLPFDLGEDCPTLDAMYIWKAQDHYESFLDMIEGEE